MPSNYTHIFFFLFLLKWFKFLAEDFCLTSWKYDGLVFLYSTVFRVRLKVIVIIDFIDAAVKIFNLKCE